MTSFASANTLAETARHLSDVSRAAMLMALMDGRAFTASELASRAGIGAPAASEHLARLVDGQFVTVTKQGRHRYFKLASVEIAQLIESLMAVASTGPSRHRPPGPADEAMRAARSCYDHIAGRLAIDLLDGLTGRGFLVLEDDALSLTPAGRAFFCEMGMDASPAGGSKRPFCRCCLDWSERRPHLAGRLGAAILTQGLDRNWITRVPDSRALRLTETGRRGYAEVYGIKVLR